MQLTARIRRSSLAQGLFALLLVCALAIRVAIPTGFMPAQSAQGIAISLCTGLGPITAYLPVEKKPGDGHEHDHGHGTAGAPCAFAAGLGGPLVPPGNSSATLVAPPRFALPVARAIADLTVQRLAAPPPPSQAPPARG